MLRLIKLQTLKCTTTPENCSVQTVQRSVHWSNRSVQTVQRSVLLRIVPWKPFSVPFTSPIVPCKPFCVPSKVLQWFKAFPLFGTPLVNHYKSKFRLVDRERNHFYQYFLKIIKMLCLFILIYLHVYILKVKVKKISFKLVMYYVHIEQ
jgi:hypothetical protein